MCIRDSLKTDAKFYAVHVSPSEKELQAMGSTEQEQAEAMKRYKAATGWQIMQVLRTAATGS